LNGLPEEWLGWHGKHTKKDIYFNTRRKTMFEKEAREFKEKTQKQYEEMQRDGAMPSLWANLDKIWKDGAEFGYKKQRDQVVWRVDEPPKNKRIELLCVLFDEDEYRTLQKNSWNDEYNRFIVTGTWNGAYFRGEIHHASGDTFPKVVAWRPKEEPNLGAPFYTKCLGECRD
jgi:hypothetical protein